MESDEEIPPLEDMSDALEQIKALKEQQEQKKADKSKQDMNEETISEIYNRQKNSSPVNGKKEKTNNKPVTTNKNKNSGFGGMKKGFLSGPSSKPKPLTQENKAQGDGAKSTSSGAEKRKTLEDIPFIKKKDEKENLQLPEVQETMSTSENLLKKQEWITDDLMTKLETNQTVFMGFQNPEYIRIIGEFKTDPQAAMEKYKDHQQFQEFFREFCKLMGDHFGGQGEQEASAQSDEQVSQGELKKPEISVVPESEAAEMSVRSSTNPKQPTAEDERKMQEILSSPEIRSILTDPKIAELFETVRKNPEAAQRLMREADDDFKRKIQKLVEVGLLQFQV